MFQPISIDQQLKSRNNNFDAMRLIAAALVVYSHCYHIYGLHMDPWTRLTGFKSFGGLGVAVFFVMSGFLVARSYEMDPSVGRFVRKRAMRILPALVACAGVTVFLIGPIVTTLPLGEYLAQTATYLHFVRVPLMVNPPLTLPGVFDGSPFLPVVNGSLWTLQYEVAMYVGVALLGWLGARGVFWPLALLVLALLGDWHLGDAVWLRRIGSTTPQLFHLAILFFSGVFMWAAREKVVFRLRWFALLAALFVGSMTTPYFPLVFVATIPYLTLYLAFAKFPVLPKLSSIGDFSYGMYIYAFPVQQSIIQFLPPSRISMSVFFFLSLVATLSLAMASWYLVERPCLAWRPARKPASVSGTHAPKLEAVQH